MKKLLVVLVFLVASGSASAQETWHSLMFGMADSAARDAMTKDGFSIKEHTDGWNASPDWELSLPGLDLSNRVPAKLLYFVPSLTFSSDAKLISIALLLDYERHRLAGVTDEELLLNGVPKIETELIGKYGAPASKSGDCRPEALLRSGPFVRIECDEKWSANGQTVACHWLFLKEPDKRGTLFLNMTYTATSKKSGL